MRQVILSIACSLDGFIAGPNGELDWLQFGPEAKAEIGRVWSSVDAILMGRKTYEFALKSAGGGGGGDDGGMETYVFSRTLDRLPKPGAHLVRDRADEFIRELKARKGRTIFLMGGGGLASSLLRAGVVDEVTLNVHPVLLGSGPALFHDAGRNTALKLKSTRAIAGGCVLTTYAVN